ncbi:MAG: hypothetical protein DME57_03810 [Verrucomicrobia bacterium]|nr:MAG: hypothetical protein DME57_03810 [Verrucomicrobiota bacterium]
MNPKTKIILTVLLGLAWAGVAVVGGHALLSYENAPGEVGKVPSAWPVNSSIRLATDRPTLVVFAHPQCPCTRASISELASIVAHTQSKARVLVLFYTPRDTGDDWRNTDNCRTAAQIPGVSVLADVDGEEAERFGAETSGHAFLFEPNGRLLFNGGITASRGHAGGNAGESAIVSLIDNQSAGSAQAFVFGCSFKTQREGDRKCLK